jgi:hypothetical protein
MFKVKGSISKVQRVCSCSLQWALKGSRSGRRLSLPGRKAGVVEIVVG